MRHIQQLEDKQADRLMRSVRERTEPLHTLITKAAAKLLRDITTDTNALAPQDQNQANKIIKTRPDSVIGTMLSNGASLEEVAIWLVKRALEKWVRVLRPFASGPGLTVLISRLVHEEFLRINLAGSSPPDSPCSTGSRETIPIVPPRGDLLGDAFRALTPLPQDACADSWVFVEDLESALTLEAAFSANPTHPLRPNAEAPKLTRSTSTSSRPYTCHSGFLQKAVGLYVEPKNQTGGVRRSGAFPWSDFQTTDGFRQTTMNNNAPKHVRRSPGPDRYEVVARSTAPVHASFGRFPRAGLRRNMCSATPLSNRSRFFEEEYRVER